MDFRTVVREVLRNQGVSCSAKFLSRFSDKTLAEMTNLPEPDDLSRTETITFEGETSPYVRMDPKGLKSSLMAMKDKDSIVLASKKIRVEFDFGMRSKCIVWLFTEGNSFTRQSLATAISKQYRKIFSDRKRYKVWCAKLSYVHLYAIYFDPVKNVYMLDVDLHN